MVELRNPLALLLLALLPLVWYWYRRRRSRQRPATALWLLSHGKKQNRRRRYIDLRLLTLLMALFLLVLALSGPELELAKSRKLIIVIDASASMAAGDQSGDSRLAAAMERARRPLIGADEAVLVRAGLEPRAFGPTTGKALVSRLEKIQAGDARADLQAAGSLGQSLLPGAPVLVISDAAPPENADGYLNVAGNGQNAGITALGPGFAAVFNAGPANWHGKLRGEGETHELRIPPGRYAVVRFVKESPFRRASLSAGDSLNLDDLAFVEQEPVPVELRLTGPTIERALLALGARIAPRAARARIDSAPPEEPGKTPTVYFATSAGAPATVAEVDTADRFMRGVGLLGQTFHLPPPPAGSGWRVLARDTGGRPLIWRRGSDLYLPPLADWEDQPALIVLLYNWLSPLSNVTLPLGTDGVLRPAHRGGKSYSLLNVAETNLPRPRPDRLSGLNQAAEYSHWLAILAALFLLIASRLKVPAKNG